MRENKPGPFNSRMAAARALLSAFWAWRWVFSSARRRALSIGDGPGGGW